MEHKKLSLEVVTPERQVLHEDVDSIQLPGLDGYLGILPGHAPLLTELGATAIPAPLGAIHGDFAHGRQGAALRRGAAEFDAGAFRRSVHLF